MTANEIMKSIKDNLNSVDQNLEQNLEQIQCDDCISRHKAIVAITACDGKSAQIEAIEKLPSVTPKPKTGHCKDCKWWKDSDGIYRRSGHAESQCPINRREVLEGNGYCYMFEPQETETWNGYHAQITAPKGTFERIFNDADDDNDI